MTISTDKSIDAFKKYVGLRTTRTYSALVVNMRNVDTERYNKTYGTHFFIKWTRVGESLNFKAEIVDKSHGQTQLKLNI